MKQLLGHSLPTLELDDIKEELNPKDLALAKKAHEQLTDIILQLASLKFNRIRYLREDPIDSFYIVPYVDPIATAYPKHKVAAYDKLGPSCQGPFSSAADWYKAIAQMNRKYTLEDRCRVECMGKYEVLVKFMDKIINEEFDHGPLSFTVMTWIYRIYWLTKSSTSLGSWTSQTWSSPYPHCV